MASLQLAKKDVRQQVKKILSEVTTESITTQTRIVTKALFSLPEFQAAQRISVYCSMPSGEISTAPIVYESLARGKQVFVPYTHKALSPNPDLPKSVMDMVSLKSRDDYESLKPDAWGIPTPSRDSILEREDCLKEMEAQAQMVGDEEKSTIGLDMIVMPGMAFDSCLRRLGHGKGFYDFFLKRYQEHWDKGKGIKARVPILVGMALKEQVLADNLEIPTDETDWLLDRLIVGDGKVLHRGNSEVI